MGVPCISLAGRCHAHNVGVTLLSAVGMQDAWVAHTKKQYIEMAAQWASKPHELAALRRQLRSRALDSPLCDARTFLAELEARYCQCFERWRYDSGNEQPSAAEQVDMHDSLQSSTTGSVRPASPALAANHADSGVRETIDGRDEGSDSRDDRLP